MNLNNIPGIKFSSVNGKVSLDMSTPDKFATLNPHRLVLDDPDVSGYGYVFFTRPDLNLNHKQLMDSSNDFYTFVKSLSEGKDGKKVLQSLTKSNFIDTMPGKFINILTGSAMSFSPQDTTLRTKDVGETYSGYKVIMPSTNSDSISGQLSIEFEESQHLYITKLHKVWLDYMELVRRGFIEPKSKYVKNRGYRILDYVSSIYYFKTLPDGETITYWAKYTGVFPTTVPYSSLGFQHGSRDATKLSVNYSFSFKDDLDPEILSDFNKLNVNTSANQTQNGIFNPSYSSVDDMQSKISKTGNNIFNYNVQPNRATIKKETINGNVRYKLKFLKLS